jgi:signal recognition particle subunit SRP54
MDALFSLFNDNTKWTETLSKMKSFLVMMDSMTNEELDNPDPHFDQSRKIRIVKGSGKDIELFNEMMRMFQKMKKQVNIMKKPSKQRELLKFSKRHQIGF